ncbi:hypothetical protein KAT80_02225 [Candidatus Pacearchaeota archaeon]|nr:hypothetical protein [Candidatus Pacearchaeota archaeon]
MVKMNNLGKKNFNLFLYSFGIIILVLCLYFVIAMHATDIIFESNSSAYADSDGHFTINWSNDTTSISPICNWTVALWMNDNIALVTDNANTSVYGEQDNSSWGYTWTNTTEANYTFSFSAFLANGTRGDNSTNVSMYVDLTAPLVNWTGSGYTNLTYKQNTTLLTLNISVGDAHSGVGSGISYCVFDINGTNETVAVSGGWCNTTQLNLTGLADGNHTIDIWANDSANNVGVNLSTYIVWIDNTAPVATFTCSPSSVNSGGTVTCTCTGTDSGSGVNTSLTTSAATITTNSTLGTFTTTDNCTITDYAGNIHNATTTYTVTSDAATDSTSSTTTALKWTKSYSISDNQFTNGYTQQLATKGRIKFKVGGTTHQAGVLELTETTVKIEVSSTPQEATLAIGDVRKFDVDEDEYYDVVVTLNSILDGKANITVKSINELITVETEAEEQEKEESAGDVTEDEEEDSSLFKKWWFWMVAVLVVAGIIYNSKKNK